MDAPSLRASGLPSARIVSLLFIYLMFMGLIEPVLLYYKFGIAVERDVTF